jgi:hypothetical protein
MRIKPRPLGEPERPSIIRLLIKARKKGTDLEYRKWIRQQVSCISGQYSAYPDGEGRNPACHVRRAGKSGTGYKAEYSCVPMTNDEHLDQTNHGEAHCLSVYYWQPRIWTNDQAKAWFDEQRIEYLERWVNS